jgi:hypothetical protein
MAECRSAFRSRSRTTASAVSEAVPSGRPPQCFAGGCPPGASWWPTRGLQDSSAQEVDRHVLVELVRAGFQAGAVEEGGAVAASVRQEAGDAAWPAPPHAQQLGTLPPGEARRSAWRRASTRSCWGRTWWRTRGLAGLGCVKASEEGESPTSSIPSSPPLSPLYSPPKGPEAHAGIVVPPTAAARRSSALCGTVPVPKYRVCLMPAPPCRTPSLLICCTPLSVEPRSPHASACLLSQRRPAVHESMGSPSGNDDG